MTSHVPFAVLITASLLWSLVSSQCFTHEALSACSSTHFEYDCSDCRAFWKCDRGRWMNAQCVQGMAFHPHIKTCVDEAMVPSCWGQQNEAPSKPITRRKKRQTQERCNSAIECPQNARTMFIPDFNDCGHFYVCNYRQLEDHYCSQYGFKFYNPRNINCEVGTQLEGTPAPIDNMCVYRR